MHVDEQFREVGTPGHIVPALNSMVPESGLHITPATPAAGNPSRLNDGKTTSVLRGHVHLSVHSDSSGKG